MQEPAAGEGDFPGPARGLNEAILLNQAGDVCEAATANLFMVRDSTLMTPELASGCLPACARPMGRRCQEGTISPAWPSISGSAAWVLRWVRPSQG